MLQTLSDALWRPWMLVFFLFTGLWCSLSGGFYQLFGLKSWLKESFHTLREPKEAGGEKGLSPFQALCTALASTMGTGSIAGVATAITLGGAGALLWMWVVAVLGMMTGYVEKFLAVRHRRRGRTGWEGGPLEYLTALGWHRAGGWFALWCALSSLTGEGLSALLSGREETFFLRLSLPKFEQEWSGELKDALAALGLTDAFDPDLADFSLLGDDPRGYYLSQVIHAARIEVNEEGTEAAAATVVAAASGAVPPQEGVTLIFDRPFLYGIVDLQNGVPLFLGTFEGL